MLACPEETDCGEGWRWKEEWSVEMKRIDPDGALYRVDDPEGWEYARNWPESRWRSGHLYGPQSKSNMPGQRSKVRRRLWVRTKVATECGLSDSRMEGDEGLAHPHSAALDSALLEG